MSRTVRVSLRPLLGRVVLYPLVRPHPVEKVVRAADYRHVIGDANQHNPESIGDAIRQDRDICGRVLFAQPKDIIGANRNLLIVLRDAERLTIPAERPTNAVIWKSQYRPAIPSHHR